MYICIFPCNVPCHIPYNCSKPPTSKPSSITIADQDTAARSCNQPCMASGFRATPCNVCASMPGPRVDGDPRVNVFRWKITISNGYINYKYIQKTENYGNSKKK